MPARSRLRFGNVQPNYQGGGGGGLGNQLYEDTASFGRFMNTIGTVIGLICCAIFFFIGVKVYNTPPVYTVPASMKVNTVNAIRTRDSKGNLIVTYDVMGTISNCGTNPVPLLNADNKYSEGGKYNVFITKGCSSKDARISTENNKLVGGGIAFGMIVVAILICAYYYIIHKYKFAAAASGVGSAFNMIGGGSNRGFY